MSSYNDDKDSKECPLTTSRKRRPMNLRSVSFSLTDTVKEIPHLNAMSEEEIESIWISDQEATETRQTCMRLVTLMNLCHDKKERGLDQHTFSEKARKDHMRRQLYKAVSAIQEYQMKNQVWIPDILAGICQKYSAACELEAHVVGLRDEVEIYSSI
jgi:hypothetical protein